MTLDLQAFEQTRRNAIQHLLDQRNAQGHWTGYLSSSALSTATAITALTMIDPRNHAELIPRGAAWLVANQNADGGWGDTDKSLSNISTTTLCWAALGLPEASAPGIEGAADRARQWLTQASGGGGGGESIDDLVAAIMRRYGKDRTFSVPILTMATLCGRLGDPRKRSTWRYVMQLPFELAALPQSWFRLVNMQVVSYALPALIAIGQVRHHHRPTRNLITRALRRAAIQPTMRRLEAIQPSSGGFLEATPLTSFVSMSLAACGFADHAVTQKAAEFLRRSMRDDGSWPIDTNLATWVTTLSVNALAAGSRLNEYLAPADRAAIRGWLLTQQHNELHPYTGAAPGGWAWTDRPGGVPDADDTSGAILALHQFDRAAEDRTVTSAIDHGNHWSMDLQNRDGGIPTFCRGWGRLPFDRSSMDITAHALRAYRAGWFGDEVYFSRRAFEDRASAYLARSQTAEGAWAPLWFGNQHCAEEENLTYGTSRVLLALAELSLPTVYPLSDVPVITPVLIEPRRKAAGWLMQAQNADGGWGGGTDSPSSIEETALAVEALAVEALAVEALADIGMLPFRRSNDDATRHAEQARRLNGSIERGVAWLMEHTQHGTQFDPSPIGFYFAKLWYYEMLYPVVFTVGALERVAKLWAGQSARAEPRPPANAATAGTPSDR